MAAPGSPCSEYTLRRRVHFYEVDSARIVHFSTYFRYMEEAEHALWRAAGLSIVRSEPAVGFPRVAASFEYHRPLRLEDEFEIHIRIIKISQRSIQYRCELSRGSESIATGSLTVVCIARQADQSMKAVPIPQEIASRLAVSAGAVS